MMTQDAYVGDGAMAEEGYVLPTVTPEEYRLASVSADTYTDPTTTPEAYE